MNAVVTYLRNAGAALRILLVLTVIVGIGYPLLITGIAQIPGLQSRADGSLVTSQGHVVGSALLGQNFTDARGDPLRSALDAVSARLATADLVELNRVA